MDRPLERCHGPLHTLLDIDPYFHFVDPEYFLPSSPSKSCHRRPFWPSKSWWSVWISSEITVLNKQFHIKITNNKYVVFEFYLLTWSITILLSSMSVYKGLRIYNSKKVHSSCWFLCMYTTDMQYLSRMYEASVATLNSLLFSRRRFERQKK